MDALFWDRLRMLFGDTYGAVVESFSIDKLPSFRVNTLVVPEEQGIARLRELGIVVETVPEIPLAYILTNRSKREFTDLEEYKNGWYYLQSLSSMVPVSTLVGEPVLSNDGLHALDMCAAPGSKTSQLAALIGGREEIYALDVSRQRIFQMKSVLRQLQVNNVLVSQSDASAIWKKFGPIFDIVLLDAPCSGEGRFKAADLQEEVADEKKRWSLKNIERMAAIQKRLIFSAVMCLKQGGVLIYSTCTFAPEENEAVINFALEKFEGAIEIEPISGNFLPGLTRWNSDVFDERLHKSARILPSESWDGFFVCKIRRN